jgi:nucleobase:cation symporter-1, NCS1 family
MIAAWASGFVVYQLINPGTVGGWRDVWTGVRDWLHVTPASWMSASLLSFAVAALVAYGLGRIAQR